ncbi:MAG TPA: 3D domain-containing protein [Enterococcus sp.]|nr:3D domain-containing protein [Enterococcus sp.]
MKAKKFLAICLLGMTVTAPLTVSAESLESLDKKEEALLQKSETISADVQLALQDVNQKYQEVEELKDKIAKNEATLASTKEEMKATEEKIVQRKQLVADRLRTLQLNRASENKLMLLLQASSIQEFVSGVYAISVLQTAEKDALDELDAEVAKLQELEVTATTTQNELETSEHALVTEANDLDSKINDLQDQLSDNQDALQSVAQSKYIENERLKAEVERKAAEKREAEQARQAEEAKAQQEKEVAESQAKETQTEEKQETTVESKTSSEDTSTTTTAEQSVQTEKSTNKTIESETKVETPKQETNRQPEETQSTGRVLYMESTAYSYAEAGASFYTASGLDLRQNPQAVAVDTNVIPLGTLVEVEGYGVAIAADTGGAIKGNIIDVHFKTPEECLQWGRRYNVKVTILQ